MKANDGKVERVVRRCGACNAKFANARDLVEHIKICAIARAGKTILERALDDDLEPNNQASEKNN